ncbi:MAG: ruvB, partial [Blastococcus sp.]|nr:ruvB [Blastococcus sp.]
MSAPFDRPLLGEVDGALGQDAAVSPLAGDEERVVESALRPHNLHDFIGQRKVARQLALVLEGAKRRGRPPDHVLLSGPPGLGKTSLALIIGSELGTSVKITSGPAIERSGDLAAMLSNLSAGDVLFIDEIHRIARPAEELLYMAMEDFRVDVVVGKGPGATA